MADDSLASFARRMRLRGIQVEEGANEVKRLVALAVDRELVLSTPVDTGRARSNWIVSTGTPSAAEIAAYAPGESGSTAASNSAAAMGQAQAAIAGVEPGQDIAISNNLPYIGRLNDGYSAQAPAGFVEQAILNGVQVAARHKVLK